MKNLIDRLTAPERRALTVLLALGAAALLVFFYAFLRERPDASKYEDRLAARQREFRSLSPQWEKTRVELARWRQAERDMAELKRDRFYSDVKGFQDLRLDLQSLFDASGIAPESLAYGYNDFAKEGLLKVNADFTFRGTYPAFRKLLDLVERNPRFLCVEKVDFLDIGTQPGVLALKITMAAYYVR
jgi:hypothetical protein